jgi:hypothetical protein
MSHTAPRHRVHRWSERFPPRGAWHALAGTTAAVLLVNNDLVGAIASLAGFGVAEVAVDVAQRRG